MSNKQASTSKKSVVVVGGGFAGAGIARQLSTTLSPEKYELTLVDARPSFIGMIAGLRVVVTGDKALRDQVLTPFDRVFEDKSLGKFRQAKVIGLEQTGASSGVLRLEGEEDLPYDALVLATGSIWPGLLAFPDSGANEFIQQQSENIEKARKILLVGAGSVGLEAAGEIRDIYKDTEITIIHRGSAPLSATYPDKFRSYVQSSWAARDVKFVFEDELETIPETVTGEVKTKKGRSLNVDLVLDTRGPRPNTAWLNSIGSFEFSDTGRIKVIPTLQVKGYETVFAAGDIIDWDEAKMAAKVNAQVGLVANNVKVALEGTGNFQQYKGFMEGILITNGKDAGVVYLPLLWGIMLGPFFARLLKSKDLMISRMRASVGY